MDARPLSLLAVGLALFAATGCTENPMTFAVHEPIYPAANEAVKFRLEKVSGPGLTSAELFETVSTIDASGAVTSAGTETSLQSWSNPGNDITHTRGEGYAANSLVNYRWVVSAPKEGGGCGSTVTYTHNVTFAVRPYPVANAPAPVYAVGDPDDVFDVVLVPDTDITDLAVFRDHVRRVIRESFFDEATTRVFRRSFNFYINPATGHATDFDKTATDGNHQKPSNDAKLSFAEGRAILHQGDLRDYAWSGYFSSEMQNRGTILHESGHALFGLADEYAGGAHWEADPHPNNWNSSAEAAAAAPGFGKTSGDVTEIKAGAWWKVCVASCQMKTTGLTHDAYDRPCHDRVVWAIIDNAVN